MNSLEPARTVAKMARRLTITVALTDRGFGAIAPVTVEVVRFDVPGVIPVAVAGWLASGQWRADVLLGDDASSCALAIHVVLADGSRLLSSAIAPGDLTVDDWVVVVDPVTGDATWRPQPSLRTARGPMMDVVVPALRNTGNTALAGKIRDVLQQFLPSMARGATT